jgi:hemerythrin
MTSHSAPPPFASPGWHDGLLLGHDPMDRAHEEFVGLIAALEHGCGTGLELKPALDALAAHACSHFDTENAWMSASDFPARECHVAEHDAVLRSIEGVRRRVAQGERAPAQALARELAAWFPAHCDYLDAALAHWLCASRFGGKPVVVRRQMPATAV